MANALAPSIEPFVDRVSPNYALAHGHFLRVGYRAEGTDRIFSAIDLPVQVLEEEIASGLQLMTSLTLSGGVMSQVVGSSGLALLGPRSITSIDNLVSEAVSTDNLRLEEASTNELLGLLRTLESAIDHVRTALTQVRSEV